MSNRCRNGGAWNWSVGCVVVGVAAIGLAGCGSGSSSPTATTHPSTTTSMPGVATTTTATTSGTGTGTAVVNAWESAQQTLYAYLQAPWQQDRADLVAGETAATLWPNLANYFANPALHSEQTFLVGVKMGQLNGPSSFNLGSPKVSALMATTATVTGCIYDSGTTTAAGKPGPANLDGGGAGGYDGTWNLDLVSGSWKIASFKTSSVPKC
jgi:hypothetical protein